MNVARLIPHLLARSLKAQLLLMLALCLLSGAAFANTPGKNGTRTITAANTVVNQSSTISIAASAGASTITVQSIRISSALRL